MIKELLGIGPKVVRERPDGKAPWSTTVVNVNRLRNRRKKRRMLLVVVGLMLVGACVGCGLFAKLKTEANSSAQLPGRPSATSTSTPPTITRDTIKPKATPIPIQPTQTPTPITAQVTLDAEAGQAGSVITARVATNSISANAMAVVIWDNESILSQVGITGGLAVMQFGIPASSGPGKHLLMVDVSDGYTKKRVVISFEVTP